MNMMGIQKFYIKYRKNLGLIFLLLSFIYGGLKIEFSNFSTESPPI